MKTVFPPESLEIAGQTFILRDATVQDASDVLRLHRRVFGSEVDIGWFDWKYVIGEGEAVGLWGAEGLVAFCGGTPRWVWLHGQRLRCLQIGDVMVAPEWRGVLKRKNPFFLVSERFYRSRLGTGRDFAAGFGFPNVRHLQLAVKTGLSWDVGTVAQWHWPVREAIRSRLEWPWRTRQIDGLSPDFDTLVNRAWDAMRWSGPDSILGERDAKYWRWRFVQRPDRQYRFVALHSFWQRRPQGIAVFASPAQAQQSLHWLDWVGPPSLLPLAQSAGLALAAKEGATGLDAWASPAMAQWLACTTATTGTKTAAGVGIPKASSLSGEQVESMNGWWTGGDTDFL